MKTAKLTPTEAAPASDHRTYPLDETIRRACARIAPTWPLDRFIAVNPLWKLVASPLPSVAAKLASLSGARLLMPRSWYREAHRDGRLRDEHLRFVIGATDDCAESVTSIHALIEKEEPSLSVRPRVVDVVDADRDLVRQPSWRSFATQSISQFCAAYFDEGQSTFAPSRDGGLYASWRRYALTDRAPAWLMGATSYRGTARALPESARELVTVALAKLDVPAAMREDYLWSLLLDQNGWASWCSYRRWTAELAGEDDDALADLLAIRLAWEWMLFQMGGEGVARRWTEAVEAWSDLDATAAAALRRDWLLQEAVEVAWQEPVIRALPAGFDVARDTAAPVQAVFCIDVRSEVFRRALEASAPSVQTLGFAGFFGLPVEYQAAGISSARPQLPGLIRPRLRIVDTGLDAEATEKRARHLDLAAGWRSFKMDPLSTFTFVEALGVTYLSKLIGDAFGASQARAAERIGLSPRGEARRKPRIVGTVSGEPLDLDARCDLAAGMLRGMSLTRHLARIVLLIGHGSSSCNNPHAAGLDCGACCGQTGEVNARAAAALLNEPEVRTGLAARGIMVPETTRFIAALHDTTSDEVTLFELDDVPASHRAEVETLRSWLAEAGAKTRRARAPSLGLGDVDPSRLDRAFKARTGDWAEVRPEWGLVNNAAFIVAPREHCRHLDLDGRAFLHEYRHEEDDGYAVLELIMTAPMIVTHWINFQYYASTTDNLRYGSGNKVLHNVVGGHLGVFEGNGGDLRIGLPLQSLHDGSRWIHTPLRLSVFIEAPRSAIDGVLQKHASVRDLVDNGWLHLFQVDERERAVYARRHSAWRRWDASPFEGPPALRRQLQ